MNCGWLTLQGHCDKEWDNCDKELLPPPYWRGSEHEIEKDFTNQSSSFITVYFHLSKTKETIDHICFFNLSLSLYIYTKLFIFPLLKQTQWPHQEWEVSHCSLGYTSTHSETPTRSCICVSVRPCPRATCQVLICMLCHTRARTYEITRETALSFPLCVRRVHRWQARVKRWGGTAEGSYLKILSGACSPVTRSYPFSKLAYGHGLDRGKDQGGNTWSKTEIYQQNRGFKLHLDSNLFM